MSGLLELLRSNDVVYTEPCACGGSIVFGTDGNGHLTEVCDGCGQYRIVTPVVAPPVPAFAPATIDPAEAAAIEESRKHLPMCVTEGCGHHVAHPRAARCPACADERRRTRNREIKREKYGYSARVAA